MQCIWSTTSGQQNMIPRLDFPHTVSISRRGRLLSNSHTSPLFLHITFHHHLRSVNKTLINSALSNARSTETRKIARDIDFWRAILVMTSSREIYYILAVGEISKFHSICLKTRKSGEISCLQLSNSDSFSGSLQKLFWAITFNFCEVKTIGNYVDRSLRIETQKSRAP